MTGTRYEVRLHAVESDSRDGAAQALARVFGIGVDKAALLLSALPRVVKRDTTEEEAVRVAAALQSIGGRAEIVAKPLQPVPVMMVVGEAPVRHSAAAMPRTSDTVKLGTQDLEAFGLGAEVIAAPAAAAQTVVTGPPLGMPQPAPGASYELPSGPLIPSALTLDPIAEPAMEITSAREQVLAVASEPTSSWRNPLELSRSQPPPAATAGLRPPSERARPPSRRPINAVKAKRPAKRVVDNPFEVMTGIWQQAQQSSWQDALRGHPVAGFVLVLGATSAAFVLVLAAI